MTHLRKIALMNNQFISKPAAIKTLLDHYVIVYHEDRTQDESCYYRR